ncbi:MAG: NAD-dependent epimerase/dehydratase family protein [Gemmatimonadaceae bacterium]
MNVLLFGATGMIGQGVLHECLLDPRVRRVVTVGRGATGQTHPKLRELVRSDVSDLAPLEAELHGVDACVFCLGVSAAGMSEARYTTLTYDLTLAVARTLAPWNPTMTFIYVSGMGTDSTERGRAMWARVKGRTENALLALPLEAAYMFRPGLIEPLPGTRSRTRVYRLAYIALAPLFPVLHKFFPNHVTTARQLGRAMLAIARNGYERPVLEVRDINRVARGGG